MSDQKKKNGKLFIAVAGILAVAILFVNVLQVVFCGTIVNAKIKDETQAQYLEFAHSYATTVTTELEKYFASLDFYVYSDPVTNGASNAEIVKWLREHNYMRSGIFDYVAWVDTDGNFDSDNFVLLNTYSHKFLHFAAQQCHRIGKEEFLKRLSMLIDKMEELNSDIKTFPLAR